MQARVLVRRSALRCASCHAALDGDVATCDACLAAYHVDCRFDLGRCGTLGCARGRRPLLRILPASRRRRRVLHALLLALAAGGLAVAAFVVHVIRQVERAVQLEYGGFAGMLTPAGALADDGNFGAALVELARVRVELSDFPDRLEQVDALEADHRRLAAAVPALRVGIARARATGDLPALLRVEKDLLALERALFGPSAWIVRLQSEINEAVRAVEGRAG